MDVEGVGESCAAWGPGQGETGVNGHTGPVQDVGPVHAGSFELSSKS